MSFLTLKEMSWENGILSLGHLACTTLQLTGLHDEKKLWGNGGWELDLLKI